MKIVLVEHHSQLQDLNKNDLVIAFYPDMYVSLLKQGYKVKTSSEFFSKDEHFIASGKSHDITQKLVKQLKEKKLFTSLTALNMFEFYIKALFGHVYMVKIQVENIKKRYPDADIIIPINNVEINLYSVPILGINDNLLASFAGYHVPREYKKNSKLINKLINMIAKQAIKRYDDFIVTSFLNSNMRDYLKNQQYIQLRLADKISIKELGYAILNYIKKKNIITLSTYTELIYIDFQLSNEENDIYSIVEYKICHIVSFIKRIEGSKHILIDLFNQKQYRILSLLNIGIVPFLAEISDMDSYLISHGSHIKQDGLSGLEHDYLANGQLVSDSFKYKVIQSPYAMDFFNYDKYIIKSYPLAWGNEFEKTKKDTEKIILLHASTPKFQLRPIIYETQFEYINSIIGVAKMVEKMENIELLVRFRKSLNFSEESIVFLLKDFKKIKVVIDKTFNYYLDKSDILISYSSTTIEEAILNEKKVIQFGDIYRHMPCIPWAKNINELENMILNYQNVEYSCKSFRNLDKLKVTNVIKN